MLLKNDATVEAFDLMNDCLQRKYDKISVRVTKDFSVSENLTAMFI
jgi:hypothetical protein